MGTMIPFPRTTDSGNRLFQSDEVAEIVQAIAERREPCRATSDYLNRPCRSIEELNELLRRREAAGEIA